jgi:hypothetical protein
MDFYVVLDQIVALLQSRGRIAYRALKLQFQLHDEAIEALKDELIHAQQLAADEEGKVLVWQGGGGVKFQQWDGTQWTVLTDWIATDQALVRPLVEAAAARYAQEKGITPRNCPDLRGRSPELTPHRTKRSPDRLQRPLRSRFRRQVSASVTRLWSLADVVAYRALEEWRSSSRTMSRRPSIPYRLTKEADHGNVYQSVEIYRSRHPERQGLAGSVRSVQGDG